MVFLSENNEAFLTHVEILWVKIASFPKSTQSLTHWFNSFIQVYNKKVQNKLKTKADKSTSNFNWCIIGTTMESSIFWFFLSLTTSEIDVRYSFLIEDV